MDIKDKDKGCMVVRGHTIRQANTENELCNQDFAEEIDIIATLKECPICGEHLGTCSDWTAKYCSNCGTALSGGNVRQ